MVYRARMLRPSIGAFSWACATLTSVASCGDAPLDPAMLAEHCDSTAPIRLLDLGPGQSLGDTRQIGDRLYLTVGTLAPDPDSSPHAPFSERSTWSTGLCGESPVHLADDLISVFTVDRWPDVVLGCQDGAGIVSLDPEGAKPPHLLFPAKQCSITYADALAWTDHGVVGIVDPTAPTSALRLFPFPDDPRSETPEPVTLLDAVDTRVLIRAWPDAVHAVTSDGDLVRVDLADRSVHVEQDRVREFQYSADRRYLMWMDNNPVVDEHGNSIAVVSLRDNLTGTATALEQTSIPPSPFAVRWADQGVLVSSGSNRVYFLPELAFVDVPNGFVLDNQIGPLDDDRWIVFSVFTFTHTPGLALLDLKDGTTATLYARLNRLLGRHQDGLLVLDGAICCIEGTYRDEGSLWHVSLDGAEPRKLADRATTFRHLPDPQRIVTAVDLATDRRGALIVVDLETRSELRIDDHVYFGAGKLAPTDDPTVLVYAVQDGDRSGVWTVRLPPPPPASK